MKKMLSLLLSLAMLCSFSVGAMAKETDAPPYVEARFTDFLNVFATLTLTDLGFLHVEGGAGTYSSEKWVEVTVTIEQYIDKDTGWEPVEGLVWTDARYTAALTQATRDVSRGTYRAHTVATCYKDGVLLETVEAYSNIVGVPK